MLKFGLGNSDYGKGTMCKSLTAYSEVMRTGIHYAIVQPF